MRTDGTTRAGIDPELVGRVRARLVADQTPTPTPARVAVALRAEGAVLGDQAVLEVAGLLRNELVGAGPLSGLLVEPNVSDVLVNAPDEVWVDRGDGLQRSGVRFRDDTEVLRLAKRLAALGGRRLDDSAPWCDVRLPDGSRLHAVLAPVSRRGTVLSIRVPARRPWLLGELRAAGTVGPRGQDLLEAVVQARLSFLVTGGTGTGKTTLLGSLLGQASAAERIVVVEDLPELQPDHPHLVALCGRPPNVEGAGEVTLRDLVRQALRMRPDRLVVGECRGAEVVDMLAALNTGHEGGCGTVHANSAKDVPARLAALGLTAGVGREALQAQLVSGLQVVVHLARGRTGRRVLAEIGVLEPDVAGAARVRRAYSWRDGDVVPSDAADALDGWLAASRCGAP